MFKKWIKCDDKRLGIKQKILYIILEFIVFCAVWMIVGPYFVDIDSYINMFDFSSAYLCWFLSGCSLYIGGKIIYICICKVIKVMASHINKHNYL